VTTRTTSKPIEVTLPSGIFAHIRPMRFLDRLQADFDAKMKEIEFAKAKDDERAGVPMFVAALISRTCTFDDVRYTVEQVLEMDCRDADAVCEALIPYMKGPIR
jgi:hypothetical protein